MTKKKNIQDEINGFLEMWDYEQISEFFRHIEPLLQLYDITEEKDWVADKVGEEDATNVRLIRTVYLMSRISELFAGRFVNLNVHFKKLWQRLENQNVIVSD